MRDLRALTTCLLGDRPPAATPLPAKPLAGDAAQRAVRRELYLDVCTGCHGAQGEGKPHVAVAMRGNSTLRHHDPHNRLVRVLDGVDAQDFLGDERMQDMPGFAGKLNDHEVAQLASYLRAEWGGQLPDVVADQVRKLRR
jgi:mono/diheme cytochrome c family protein